jgi:hypothetical protein
MKHDFAMSDMISIRISDGNSRVQGIDAWVLCCLLVLVICGLPQPLLATQGGPSDAEGRDAQAPDSAIEAPAVKVLPRPPNRAKPSRAAIDKLIARTAKRYGVERDLVHSVVRAESAYNAHAVSPVGAIGLMQIMPATGADYGVGSVDALFDAQTNIRVGVRHLKRLVGRYGIGKAVMAYNAGEGALARHNGFVTYAETQRYTHRVLTSYLNKKGVTPYSVKAREITGITLTPAMASAGGGSSPSGRRLLRRVDLSKLSLRVRPTLSDRALDPTAHRLGPESKPMFVLEPASATD